MPEAFERLKIRQEPVILAIARIAPGGAQQQFPDAPLASAGFIKLYRRYKLSPQLVILRSPQCQCLNAFRAIHIERTVDEVANVAELLMRGKGTFITGTTFLIDGGTASSYY